MSEITFWCTSILGYNTGKPLVQFSYPGGDVMISPAKARSLALNLLQCADAAQSDMAIFGILTESVGLDVNSAGRLIKELRDRRANDANEIGD